MISPAPRKDAVRISGSGAGVGSVDCVSAVDVWIDTYASVVSVGESVAGGCIVVSGTVAARNIEELQEVSIMQKATRLKINFWAEVMFFFINLPT